MKFDLAKLTAENILETITGLAPEDPGFVACHRTATMVALAGILHQLEQRNERRPKPRRVEVTPLPVNVAHEPVLCTGMFLHWGEEFEELEGGPGNFTVAIVELPDGQVVKAFPERVRFLDAAPRHSPACGTAYRGCAPDCPAQAKWDKDAAECATVSKQTLGALDDPACPPPAGYAAAAAADRGAAVKRTLEALDNLKDAAKDWKPED